MYMQVLDPLSNKNGHQTCIIKGGVILSEYSIASMLIVQRLDQMGPFHILLDEMGLDQMGLDKVGRPRTKYL